MTFTCSPAPLFFVISGPGGTGKTTLIREWRKIEPDLHYVPNVTTRKPRPASAVDEAGLYEFVSFEKFRALVEADYFAQWVNPSEGKYYGTPRAPLDDALTKKQDLVFDYTPQLYINLRQLYREHIVSIFVMPPSLEELRRRLETRNTESGRDLEIKYQMALQDLAFVEEHDYHVVNDDFEKTLRTLQSIRVAEKARLSRQTGVLPEYLKRARRSMLFYYDPSGTRTQRIGESEEAAAATRNGTPPAAALAACG